MNYISLRRLSLFYDNLKTVISGKVSKSGDTLEGPLDMGSNKITSSYIPSVNNDIVNYKFISDNISPKPDINPNSSRRYNANAFTLNGSYYELKVPTPPNFIPSNSKYVTIVYIQPYIDAERINSFLRNAGFIVSRNNYITCKKRPGENSSDTILIDCMYIPSKQNLTIPILKYGQNDTFINYLRTIGGELTGDLTVGNAKMQVDGHIIGTSLQATDDNALDGTPSRICVQDDSGMIYSRTPEQIAQDIGLSGAEANVQSDWSVTDTTSDSYIKNKPSIPIVFHTTATITTTWTGTTAPYSQNRSVSGLLSTDSPIIDIVTSTSNYAQEEEEWAKIFKITPYNGGITIYANDKTTITLTIQIKVVR